MTVSRAARLLWPLAAGLGASCTTPTPDRGVDRTETIDRLTPTATGLPPRSPTADTDTVPTAESGSSGTTADTGARPPLQLVLHQESGQPTALGEALTWTMAHGPAGGWSLTVRGVLSGLPPSAVSHIAVTADTLGTDPDPSFTTRGPNFFAVEADPSGRVELGPWPLTEPRLYAPTTSSADICALGGQSQQLVLRLDELDVADPGTVLRSLDHTQSIDLMLDPIDVDLCAE